MAWVGAHVIRVHPSTSISSEPPDLSDLLLNSNKSSVTLNLDHAGGLRLLKRLLDASDVVIEDFVPNTREGQQFARLPSLTSPRLVYAHIGAYSSGGPGRDVPASDAVAQAAGGIMSLTGEPNGPPIRPGANFGDSGTALHVVIGIIAALYQRLASGEGQRIEVAMQEAMINFCRMAYAGQLMTGRAPQRVGNGSLLARSAPSDAYPCHPGGPNDYCFVYTSRADNRHWHRLLGAIGREDLIADTRFATPESRLLHRDVVDELIASWTTAHNKIHVMETLGRAGVPAGAVFDTAELSNDTYLRARGVFVDVVEGARRITIPGWPVHMSASRIEVSPGSKIGADTKTVLVELLESSDDEIAGLRATGVI
jgi:formyl-CoA transferase